MKKKYCFIVLFFLCSQLFCYDWNNKIEVFSYELTDKNESNYKWVLKEYYDTIYSKDRDFLSSKIPKFLNKSYFDLAKEKQVKWFETRFTDSISIGIRNNKERLVFEDIYFDIDKVDILDEENIKLTLRLPDYSRRYIQETIYDWSFIENKKNIYIAYITFDGDYIYLYFENYKYLFATFCKISNTELEYFNNCMHSNNWNDFNITWPRHADGSCDYDGTKTTTTQTTSKTTSSTNVTKNKIMTIAENLKLRSGEATSTQVLTVMAAGTKVKILELGKAETIDGISSNWVKVEIQADAKDRDGKPIKKGTVGWCYGGYLK